MKSLKRDKMAKMGGKIKKKNGEMLSKEGAFKGGL